MVFRAGFKMADGRITFVSSLLGLFSSLIACLAIDEAVLNVKGDYVRKRLNIIRLLSLLIPKASLKRLHRGRRQTRSRRFWRFA